MNTEDSNAREIPLSWFTRSLWKYTPLYVELVFLAICLRLIGLVEPFIFQVIIDRILPFQREASLVVVVAIFAAVSLFQMGFEILSNLLGVLTANKVTRDFGARIFDHLFKLPLSHFRKWSVGETIARVRETETIRNFLVGTTTGVFLDLLFVVIYISVLLALSVPLTMIVLIALPLQALIYFVLGPFLRQRLRVQFDAGARHQTQMVENISGIAAVKALSAEDKMLERLDQTLYDSLNARYRVSLLNIVSDKLTFIVERSVTIAIIYVGANLVFAGELTLGQLIAFHLLAGKVTDPIANFSQLWEGWQNIKVSRQRLGDIVSSPMEPFDAQPRLLSVIEPRLTFEEVSFGYTKGTLVLRHFSFVAQPNTLTLVVGPSGIGKSTFGRLAAGIDVPAEGVVRLGGEDITKFEPHDVRSKIAYIPQEPYLFSGTLRENLLISEQDVSEEDLQTALRIAAADTLVARLPLGLETQVGERGSALSGGQRQRIAIARSLIKKPKVLVLDEPTNALDDAAQRKMAKELARLKPTTTLIVITHRPEIFEDPDQIVDFEALA
ncbi:peptidase domain-containing ABC transporter [uncultured Tateyamaria sp.]|uniref:peptidase domain-containing ABC transporter n=1 Tax=uncultured Tateyamaria sp. TaxID=455651 RepID=UPI002620B129|nr:peptidase domain-containing ABC transporter [uncultured Tateyamaria sp.]